MNNVMFDLVAELRIPAYLVDKVFKKGLKPILNECDIKIVGWEETVEEETKMEIQPPTPADKPNEVDEQWQGKQRMVKFRCPECGRINFKVCKESGKFICFGCGLKYDFSLDELSKVVLTCPECGGEQYFWMPEREGMAISSDACRECGREIAFSYSSKEGQYVNF